MENWNDFRLLFPALEGRAYLNTAGGGVMAGVVAEAGMRYYRESLEMGDIGWTPWLERSEKDRADLASIIGADPAYLAFLPNASLGFNILARALPSDASVLALDQEFPSCTTPFLSSGHHVDFLGTARDGAIGAEMLEKYLQAASTLPTAFVLSSVQFANGFRADLASLSAVCHRHGVLFLVDATQSIGAFPLNMQGDGIDALVFSGYKWATAGYGTAVLATGPGWPSDQPPLVGWRSARDAYALENDRLDMLPGGIGHEMGHPPFPNIFAMGAALRLLSETGIEAIAERVIELTDYLVEGLQRRGVSVRSNREPDAKSGIVLADFSDAASLCQALRTREVWTSARNGGLRISVHGYNDRSDLDRLFDALDELGARSL